MSTKRSFPCMVRADTHIVQFFTGRKDRNGKEVYNGDIVDVDEGMGRFLVKWDEKETGFYLDYKGIDDEAVTLSTVENGEVIGNIFENPELLEVSPK
ncbi:MAG: hypothetical protein VR68_11830 [Peptococcaceae bacterium BRH_c4a]|nr:MAG: hypothetical protein VR68_11830 [Peptococcaceae bacterium BRH_c4a]